jgi:hypothetical protein
VSITLSDYNTYSKYIYCIGDRWCCLQAVQDPRRTQVHRSRPHRDAPEAEGEPPQALQEQEVQAAGPEAQEDPRHPQGAHRPREEPQDRQDSAQAARLPRTQVRRQAVNSS